MDALPKWLGGADFIIAYDTSLLEFQSASLGAALNAAAWDCVVTPCEGEVRIGLEGRIGPGQVPGTNLELVTLTFKVLPGVQVGSSATLTLNNSSAYGGPTCTVCRWDLEEYELDPEPLDFPEENDINGIVTFTA